MRDRSTGSCLCVCWQSEPGLNGSKSLSVRYHKIRSNPKRLLLGLWTWTRGFPHLVWALLSWPAWVQVPVLRLHERHTSSDYVQDFIMIRGRCGTALAGWTCSCQRGSGQARSLSFFRQHTRPKINEPGAPHHEQSTEVDQSSSNVG